MPWREVIVDVDIPNPTWNPEMTVATSIREWGWFPEPTPPRRPMLVPWVRLEVESLLLAGESLSWPRWAWLRRRNADRRLRRATGHGLDRWIEHREAHRLWPKGEER